MGVIGTNLANELGHQLVHIRRFVSVSHSCSCWVQELTFDWQRVDSFEPHIKTTCTAHILCLAVFGESTNGPTNPTDPRILHGITADFSKYRQIPKLTHDRPICFLLKHGFWLNILFIRIHPYPNMIPCLDCNINPKKGCLICALLVFYEWLSTHISPLKSTPGDGSTGARVCGFRAAILWLINWAPPLPKSDHLLLEWYRQQNSREMQRTSLERKPNIRTAGKNPKIGYLSKARKKHIYHSRNLSLTVLKSGWLFHTSSFFSPIYLPLN